MSKTYTYKNVSDEDLSIVGVGLVASGKTIRTTVQLENPQLRLVTSKADNLDEGNSDVA